MVTIRVLNDAASIPTYATAQSACADVYACLQSLDHIKGYTHKNLEIALTVTDSRVILQPGYRALIPTGWAIALPEDHVLRFYNRSGLATKTGVVLANAVGVIDADYRHEVFVALVNTSDVGVVISHMDRIAQAEITPVYNLKAPWYIATKTEVPDSDWFDTDRLGGFGSTGK